MGSVIAKDFETIESHQNTEEFWSRVVLPPQAQSDFNKWVIYLFIQ